MVSGRGYLSAELATGTGIDVRRKPQNQGVAILPEKVRTRHGVHVDMNLNAQ